MFGTFIRDEFKDQSITSEASLPPMKPIFKGNGEKINQKFLLGYAIFMNISFLP